jgi:hypothetical protein
MPASRPSSACLLRPLIGRRLLPTWTPSFKQSGSNQLTHTRLFKTTKFNKFFPLTVNKTNPKWTPSSINCTFLFLLCLVRLWNNAKSSWNFSFFFFLVLLAGCSSRVRSDSTTTYPIWFVVSFMTLNWVLSNDFALVFAWNLSFSVFCNVASSLLLLLAVFFTCLLLLFSFWATESIHHFITLYFVCVTTFIAIMMNIVKFFKQYIHESSSDKNLDTFYWVRCDLGRLRVSTRVEWSCTS